MKVVYWSGKALATLSGFGIAYALSISNTELFFILLGSMFVGLCTMVVGMKQ